MTNIYHNQKKTGKVTKPTAFTLIELLAVVTILGIVSVIVIPQLGNADDLYIEAAIQQIAADLLYAQTCAIAKQKQFQVVFDAANNSYEIQDSTGTVITHPVNGTNYTVDFANDERFKSVVLDTAAFDTKNKVWFDWLGAPYSGNIVDNAPLTSGIVNISIANLSASVTVVPVSGRISIN